MSEAFNSFLIVKLADERPDKIGGIAQYITELDSTKWMMQNPDLKIGFVKSFDGDRHSYKDYITNPYAYNKSCMYTVGECVLIDDTKIIHRFEDNQVLIRNDAVIAFYNLDEEIPYAGENQVVIQIEDRNNLEMNDLAANGYVGIVRDIMINPEYDDDNPLSRIEIGDRVILAMPRKTERHPWENLCAFTKLSTNKGFFVVANVKTIACVI